MATAGADRPVEQGASLTVLQAIREYKREAEDAKRTRLLKNKANFDAYLGNQDWSHKQLGQSTEFLPKTPVAVEQWSAFMKRALIQFGQWKSADVAPDYPLKAQDVLDLLDTYLDRIPAGHHKTTTLPLILSDAIKVGLLEALIILKIYGRKVSEREFFAEPGVRYVSQTMSDGTKRTTPVATSKLKRREKQTWRLCVDLVRPEDYFPDPSGRALYEIHQVDRDLHDVDDLAEQGIYDTEVVALIQQDFAKAEEEWGKSRKANQDYSAAPGFRKQVRIDEFWGDILDGDGRLAERNVLAAVANDRYLLRPPEPNPLWHGESPFVAAPLIRVPWSVWHKAIYDHASPLNFAENELFNLMLDGGISSVWGIKQLRADFLEDPRQVAGGIPQGITLSVKAETPPDMKVLETVATGHVPPESLAMFMHVDRQFDGAAYTNDLKLGLFPPKQVKACVPIRSEALTRDGWKRPELLSVGEDILALNLETERCEWTPVERLHFYDDVPTVRYWSRSFSVVCTDDHKWVKRPKPDTRAPNGSQWRLEAIDAGGRQQQILQAALGPDGKGLGRIDTACLLERENLPGLVLQMTSAERQSFILGVLAGEGTRNEGSSGAASICMTQNPGPVLDAFCLACALEGIVTHEYLATQRPGYRARRVSLLLRKTQGVCKLKRDPCAPERVWCPATRFKTWVMRQDSTICITGNTEVVEASQSQAVTLDGIAADLEHGLIAPTLRKAWLTILQNADDLSTKEVVHAVGLRSALQLSRMAPAERFAAMAQGCSFKVHGLSATLGRVRDFQKLAAYLQVVSTNPVLLQRFFQTRSVDKLLTFIEKTLNINPESITLSDEEKGQLPQLMQQLPFFQQLTGGPQRGGAAGSFAGNPEPQLPAEIQQAGNPVTGMSVGGQG